MGRSFRVMKIMIAASASALLLTGPGCTARIAYDSLRAQREMECRKLLGADQQQECLRRSGMSYDDYQKQLKERKNEP